MQYNEHFYFDLHSNDSTVDEMQIITLVMITRERILFSFKYDGNCKAPMVIKRVIHSIDFSWDDTRFRPIVFYCNIYNNRFALHFICWIAVLSMVLFSLSLSLPLDNKLFHFLSPNFKLSISVHHYPHSISM